LVFHLPLVTSILLLDSFIFIFGTFKHLLRAHPRVLQLSLVVRNPLTQL
jgi:hypothetical protein